MNTQIPLPNTTQTNDHAQLMSSLKGKHEVLKYLITGSPVHYVDLPIHGNIGDLSIMLGTLQLFKENNIRIKTKSAFFNFSPAWVSSEDVVVFHGGGNFGDLYRGPQQIRERTIAECPKNRIIILPQTIHFKSSQLYEHCCELLSQHQDLHIFVRDQTSYELAKPMSRNIYLAPDMAHQLWPLQRASYETPSGHLGIIRTDDEALNSSSRREFNLVTDWPALVGLRETVARNVYRLLRALHLADLDKALVTPASRLWIRWANMLVADAINLYSRFEYVTTDRLHGHILACLMGIPNTVIDNSYGKNSNYVHAWTVKSSLVTYREMRFDFLDNQHRR